MANVELLVATYLRMSMERQEDSPDRQRASITPYLARNRMKLYKEYVDEARRGWQEDRVAFLQLAEDAKKGRFQAIVVDELSRLSRFDPLDFLVKVAYPLREAGVALYSVLEGEQNWDNLVGIILAAVHQDKSSGESKKTSYRITSMCRKMGVEGVIDPGRPPYGYARVYMKDGVVLSGKLKGALPKLIPDAENPDRVRTIQYIFDAYVNRDMSLTDIGRELERRGVPTAQGAKFWNKVVLSAILRNPRYAGFYVFGRTSMGKYHQLHGEEVRESPNARLKQGQKVHRSHHPKDCWTLIPDHHEALVSRELFDRAQDLLSTNRTRTTPLRGRGDFLFSKLIFCGACGGPMSGTRTPAKRPYYRCSRASAVGVCSPGNVYEDEILSHVVRAMERVTSPEHTERCIAAANALDREAAADEATARLRAEVTSLTRDIDRGRARMAKVEDEGTFDYLSGQVAAWVRMRKESEEELEDAGKTGYVELASGVISDLRAMLWQLREWQVTNDRDRLRAILRQSVASITAHVVRLPPGPRGGRGRYELTGGRVVWRGRSLSAVAGGPVVDLSSGENLEGHEYLHLQLNGWNTSLVLPRKPGEKPPKP